MLNNFLKPYWKSILFTFLIFYLSFAKPTSFKELNVINLTDKWAHYLIYVAYGMVLIFEFYKKTNFRFTAIQYIIFCVAFPIVLGGLIEIVQETFFKPRSAEWVDWLCDIVGILSAVIIMKYLKKYPFLTK